MGSIVGAVSVIALVIFNARYLYLTRKMSESAAMQTATAQATLAKLENQIAANLEIERHAALTVPIRRGTTLRFLLPTSEAKLALHPINYDSCRTTGMYSRRMSPAIFPIHQRTSP